jgi:outer membrane protein assembly factor BamA
MRARTAFPAAARTALAACLLLAGAAPAAGATRLAPAGWPLTTREAEALFEPALRAPADSAALARSLHRASARLQSAGWLEASLAAAWDTAGQVLALDVASGTRFRWGALSVAMPREDSAALARLPFASGEPVDPGALAGWVERELRQAEARGHAWAQLSITGWDQDSGLVDVRLSGALGPRVQVSGVRIEGLQVTRPRVAERALGPLAGRTYDPAAARAAAARLAQLEVFTRAEFVGIEGGPQWQAGTLAYRVAEPRYNRFEGAVGVQGSAGAVGLATLELGNLLGTARAAALGWQSRGGGRSDFRVRYAEPYLAGQPFRLELALEQQLQDSTYTRTRTGARLSHVLGTGDRVTAGYEEERVFQTRGDASSANLQNTVFGFERDGRDDRASPRRGTRLRLGGTGVTKRETLRAPRAGEPATRRSRAGLAEARLEWHRPVAAGSGVALELSGTGRFSSERVLPDYERTPVGGAATLRGHDEEAFRVDRALLGRLEFRWFPGGAGERLALFWDHARMFTRVAVTDAGGAVTGDRGEWRDADGFGVGLRLRAAGGLVDVDYGLEPGRGFLDGRIHLRLVSVF